MIPAVYHVLLHLQKRRNLGSFFRLIEAGGADLAPASKLLQVYAREQNREMLRDFYYSDDRRVESAVLCLEEAANSLVRVEYPSPCIVRLTTSRSCIVRFHGSGSHSEDQLC